MVQRRPSSCRRRHPGFLVAQSPRHKIASVEGSGGGLERSGADDNAIGCEVRHSFIAGMEDLKNGRCAAASRYVGQTAQAWDKAVVIGSEFAGEANTVGLHMGSTGQNQTDAVNAGAIIADLSV